jgi:hypothetical protein
MKTYYPLKKEYPELGLKLVVENNTITFSGNATPKNLINNLNEILTYKGFSVYIASCEFPSISITSQCEECDILHFWNDKIYLWIGGSEKRLNKPFTVNYRVGENKEKLINILSKLFEQLSLNKQIRVL